MSFRTTFTVKYQHAPRWCASIFVAAFSCITSINVAAQTQMLDLEKDELKFGFIKLTDMAPLAIAYENGYFEDEGLYVTLEPQASFLCLRTITNFVTG